MPIFTVGPNSDFPTIEDAMNAAGMGDTISLEPGYSNETAVVTHTGMTIDGDSTSTGIVLQLSTGVPLVTLAGTAPINVLDAIDGNSIVGNDGDNLITVTNGVDAAHGGLGTDRLVVDYRLATGAVTGDSTTNVAEAGGPRLVTITDNTFEHFTISTGSGADTITTGAGDDIIKTGEGAGTVTAGQGANQITGGGGADTITALDGGNFIDGGNGTNVLTSGSGNDEFLSGTGQDTITAGAGNDVITVSGGADTVDSGADNDRLIVDYGALNSAVTGSVTGALLSGYTGTFADTATNHVDFVGTENFTISTGSGNDIIQTGDGLDVLLGGSGRDELRSGGGADYLSGGAGADWMYGGDGDDIYIVQNGGSVADKAFELNGEGTDVVRSSVSYSLSGQYIENLTLTGTGNINATGNGLANTIVGNGGNNYINGGTGPDQMYGGAGDDTYIVQNGGSVADKAFELNGEGIDLVQSSVSYSLAGQYIENLTLLGTGNINATGNGLANTILGNSGNNYINGGTGPDQMYGGAGDDTYVVQNGGSVADKAFELTGEGTDLVQSFISYGLAGQAIENLTLMGAGNIKAVGNSLDNIITGNSGANTLTGGDGIDTFVFSTAPGSSNVDAITDFQGPDDTIGLDHSVFSGMTVGALSADAFYAGTAAHDVSDRIVYNSTSGALFFDRDGSGSAYAAVQFATLENHALITNSDFLVV
jgi:Ca2+-binding RTX toxin-like protein